jgi:hypothetical protein
LFRYPRGKSTFCIGATEGSGSGGDGGRPSAPCAAPGDTGNEVGVGKFCSAGGGECAGNGSASACLADFAMSAFANFCTLQCQGDAQCGAGAICSSSGICVPAKCVGDAGPGGVP